ncbi:hypothetical protein ABIF65_011771 [Bradyrhizobium japonicum]
MDQQARQVADASASAGDVALHARWRGGRGRRRAGLDGVRGMGVPAPRRRSRRLQSRHRGVLGNRRHADAHNAISETLSTRPESFEPLFVRSPDGEVDPQPWCMGFYAVMKLRLLVWSRLLPPNGTEHLMLRPILVHCIDDAGRPLLPPARRTLGTQPIIQNAWRNIPATVEALRQFWMPIRFKRGA